MAQGGVEYRLYVGDQVASQKLYDMIETITVEQGIDLATEARIEVQIWQHDTGAWKGAHAPYAQAWQRVRLEVRNCTATWTPIIDGPVVARHIEASSEPGVSIMTLIARDDSVYLSRRECGALVYEGMTDDDVAADLVDIPELAGADPDIDSFPARPPARPLQVVADRTRMEALRALATPVDFHVYVVPGDTPDTSQVCVKAIDWTKQPSLQSLYLTGPNRNIESFHIKDEVGQAALQRGGYLAIDSLESTYLESQWSDVELLGDQQSSLPAADTDELDLDVLPPHHASFFDLTSLLAAAMQRASLTLTATGRIRGGCYCGVLTAYDVITVSGTDQQYCTTYVIKEVTHTLTRSEYIQDFTLVTNAYAQPQRIATPQVPQEVR